MRRSRKSSKISLGKSIRASKNILSSLFIDFFGVTYFQWSLNDILCKMIRKALKKGLPWLLDE